jgi:hypothetical protein
MANTVPALPASTKAYRPYPVSMAGAEAAHPKVGRLPRRWIVVLGLIGYCAAVWTLIAAAAVAGVQLLVSAF